MSDRETHREICKQSFGDELDAIHRFMDCQFGRYGARHRHLHHHKEGIEECAKLVSNVTGKDYHMCLFAAEQHVRLDFEIQGIQLPIPSYSDYLGGEGDWPVVQEELLKQIEERAAFFQGARVALDVENHILHAAELGILRDKLALALKCVWPAPTFAMYALLSGNY